MQYILIDKELTKEQQSEVRTVVEDYYIDYFADKETSTKLIKELGINKELNEKVCFSYLIKV